MWTKFDGVISANTNQAFSSEKSGEKTRIKSFIDKLNITGPSNLDEYTQSFYKNHFVYCLSEHTVYDL